MDFTQLRIAQLNHEEQKNEAYYFEKIFQSRYQIYIKRLNRFQWIDSTLKNISKNKPKNLTLNEYIWLFILKQLNQKYEQWKKKKRGIGLSFQA